MITVSPEKSARVYSAVVLSSKAEITGLADFADRFTPRCDPILEPAFFLASLPAGWKPRVVTVLNGSELLGVVYTKERVIKGIPTGVVYVDGSLSGAALAAPAHQQSVFRIALETLLRSRKIHALRLRLTRGSCELAAMKQVIASTSFDVGCSRVRRDDDSHCLWKYDAHLNLACTYDHFLKKLGSTTRHNFRHYRRRFEASGGNLAEDMSLSDLRAAIIDLSGKSKFKANQVERDVE